MLQSIIDNFNLIETALIKLNQLNLCLNVYEKTTITELIKNLEIFKEVSKALCAEKRSVTSKSVYYYYYYIKNFFRESKDNNYTTLSIKSFRQKVRENLDRRYELTDYHYLAFLLDQLYKNSQIIKDKVPNPVVFLTEKLNNLLTPATEPNSQLSDQQSAPAASNTQSNLPRADDLNELRQLEEEMEIPQSVLIREQNEVDKYYLCPARNISPEEFWNQENIKKELPLLRKLFLKVATIQATQCSCERCFRKTGIICTKNRISLSNQGLERIMFIKENFELCKGVVEKIRHENLDINVDSQD